MKYNYNDICNRAALLLLPEENDVDILDQILNKTITEFPKFLEVVTKIEDTTFANCTNLVLRELPSGIVSIGVQAFYGCKKLSNITFKGTPNSIADNAFGNCTNLTTINVPWAEGAVAGAPWGATNATINYNYIEG